MSTLSSRQLVLSQKGTAGNCVIYVMSRDQRIQDNHALFAGQARALELGVPLLVVFCLYSHSGHRAREHYQFMLDGLTQVEADLAALHIGFMLVLGDPKEVLINTFVHLKPQAVFFDFSPLKGPRELQKHIARQISAEVSVIDTHNCVPVWVTSTKQEVGARTLRPKIHKVLDQYIYDDEPKLVAQKNVWPAKILSLNELKDRIEGMLASVAANGQKLSWISGEAAARTYLNTFISERLAGYAVDRNNPAKAGLSGLSPYLHFGQLSSLQVVRAVKSALLKDESLRPSVEALIEEMVVRKELSDNFCLYSPSYKSLEGAPQWAQNTLAKHSQDIREFTYTLEEFEKAQTHDTAWNAAQTQLVVTGKMHGYMRMYWAKKVLEWSTSPQDAINTLIYLNDFYSIDGGDPNGYTGIMWSVAGVHDRPWGERSVYGAVRCMVYNGLKRKFDVASYENTWLKNSVTQ